MYRLHVLIVLYSLTAMLFLGYNLILLSIVLLFFAGET